MEVTLKDLLKLVQQQKEMIEQSTTNMTEKLALIETLDTRIKGLESQMTPRRVSLPGVDEEKEQFSFFRAINAIITKDWTEAGFEKEVFDNSRKRAMSTGTGSSGGYIVPEQYIAEIIEMVQANLVMAKLGVSMMTGLTSSPIDIPKQTGGSTGFWVGENQAITKSDLTFGQISMSPRMVGALVAMSNRLLRMSNPSAEAIVRRDLANCIAKSIDLAGFRGTGGAFQPLGVVNTTGINTVTLGTGAGAVPDWDTFFDMEYELEKDDTLVGNLAYVFHPAIKRILYKSKALQYSGDTAGMYFIEPGKDIAAWLGYPFHLTTQLPIDLTTGGSTNCTEILFGNWSEMIMAGWGGLEIMGADQAGDSFEKVQTWVRIIQEVDFAVRHPESFCLVNSARISAT
jgi:HK97 family phage major capsid protein